MAHLVIEHLTKDFPLPGGGRVRAVEDLNLTVEPSEWLVLVGPSGCGKTTTLRLVAGLEEPTGGSISLDGRPVNSLPSRERDLAMVFQSPALYPHLSAFENIAFGLRVRHLPRGEIAERVQATAEMLRVTDCLSRKPMELSGGQRQRIALGRALARRPRLLLLDEPLANLDPQTQVQLRNELLEIRARLATSALYVTHDQHEAMILGSRLGVVRNGILQQIGPGPELYQHPVNLFVAGFLGSPAMNFLNGTLQKGPRGLAFQREGRDKEPRALRITQDAERRLEAWINRPVVLGLRPEHIELTNPGGDEWQAFIEAVEELGPDKHVHLRTGTKALVARVPASHAASERDQVGLLLQLESAHLFDPDTERAIL